jgi:hypothetical protein
MNCDALQKHLLGRESPDRPSADADAHLAGCAACREWLLRLLQLERAVPHLPVPPAEAARSALVRRILARRADPAPPTRPRRRPSVALVLGSWIMDPHASPRRRVGAGLVAGMAAALLLFITGLLVWNSGGPPSPAHNNRQPPAVESLADALRRQHVALDEFKEPGQRVTAMAGAAEQLRGRAAGRTASPSEVIALTDLYVRVLDEGVTKPAEGLSAEERRAVLEPIAETLRKAESQWHQLSQQTGLPRDVQKALEHCAFAARDGHKKLKQLYEA